MSIYIDTLYNIVGESEHDNEFVIVGQYAFLPRKNGNNIKIGVNDNSVVCRAVSRTGGEIDMTQLYFSQYFTPKRVSPGSPWWNQHIDNGKWYFSNYEHCLPTDDDYKAIADALDDYICLFS